MIYIDPPYNKGKDFVYADDFSTNSDEYLIRSNQEGETGERYVVNLESNGRFHSKWLSMMYSNLKLAKNLLSDDGIIMLPKSYRPEKAYLEFHRNQGNF